MPGVGAAGLRWLLLEAQHRPLGKHEGGTSDEAVSAADPRTPDAVLVVSGQQIGYLEPCGCTEGQSRASADAPT